MVYSGIVFDFDGVLFDSELHWATVENPYLKSHIPRWQNKNYAELIGRSLPEVYEYLVSKYGFKLTRLQYFSDYDSMARKLYREVTAPLEGLELLTNTLRDFKDLKFAIASSSKSEWIKDALEHHPIKLTFESIVSAYDPGISNSKPAPDVYLSATAKLQISPDKLIAIEDSKNGVTAAKSAGLFCIGLRNGFNDNQDLAKADLILNGYTPTGVKQIMRLVA